LSNNEQPLNRLINLIQIVKLVLELAPVTFSEREMEALSLMRSSFDLVPSRKIARCFRKSARWSRHAKGENLVQFQGKGFHDELILVVEGSVIAFDEGGSVAMKIRAGHFLAETALARVMTDDDDAWLEDSDDSEDEASHLSYAQAQTEVTVLKWKAADLGKTLKADKELRDAFRQALAIDLSRKIANEERSNRRRNSARRFFQDNGQEGEAEQDAAPPRKKSFLSHLFSDLGDAAATGDELDLLEKNHTREGGVVDKRLKAVSQQQATMSRRSRRKRSVMQVLNFVKGGDDDVDQNDGTRGRRQKKGDEEESSATATEKSALVGSGSEMSVQSSARSSASELGARSVSPAPNKSQRRRSSAYAVAAAPARDSAAGESYGLFPTTPTTPSAKAEPYVVGRPSTAAEKKRKWRNFLASLGIGFLALVCLTAFVYLAIDDPSSTVGNGSQAVVTMAFAISDPLLLQVASFVGTSSQTMFFVFRPPRIWSSIAWSAAQACLNFSMAVYIFLSKRRLQGGGDATQELSFADLVEKNRDTYSERELFAARCLERAGGGRPLSVETIRDLLHGKGGFKPRWRTLAEPGHHVHDDAAADKGGVRYVSLLTDGVVRVTRLHAPSFDADRGALLGGHLVFAEKATPKTVRSVDDDQRRRSSYDDEEFAYDHAVALDAPVELLEWPVDALQAYLEHHPDVRRAFTILLASHACETYLDVFDPPRLS